MIHLTMTGPNAGFPLCRFDEPKGWPAWKAAQREAGDTFEHAAYADLASPDVCPKCRAEWEAAGDDMTHAD